MGAAINPGKGWPTGERHHRARLSNHDVELMRQLHEDHGLTVYQIAQKFEVPYSTARDICKYRTRCAA